MADDDGLGIEAGETLGTELGDDDRVVPEGCDLFAPDPYKVAELRKKHIDPRIAYVRVVKIEGGERVRMPGDWPAEQLSTERIRQELGPGTYECTGLNLQYTYVAKSKHTLRSSTSNGFGGGGFGAGGFGSHAGGFDANEPLEKMITRMAVMKMFQPEPDPMRGAVADMMKMMIGMGQLQLQSVQAQATVATAQKGSSPELTAMVELLKAQIAANATMRAGNGGGNGKMGSSDLLGFLQLGLSLGKQAAGVAAQPEPESAFLKFLDTLPDIVDSIGPGLVAVIAQGALSPDKAQQAMAAIHAHMAAREAEARSQVTTEGVPVG